MNYEEANKCLLDGKVIFREAWKNEKRLFPEQDNFSLSSEDLKADDWNIDELANRKVEITCFQLIKASKEALIEMFSPEDPFFKILSKAFGVFMAITVEKIFESTEEENK